MKEFKNDSTAVLSRFGRDKRTRMATRTAERVERRPHYENAGEQEGDHPYRPVKRASYNPHFTEDNRPVDGGRGERPAYGRPQGERRYGDKPHARYEEKSYGAKPYGERRYSGKPTGGYRHYDENGDVDGNRADEPRFERKPYGKTSGRTSYGNDRGGYGTRGEERNDGRGFENRKPSNGKFGGRKFSEGKGQNNGANRNKPYGGGKRGFRPKDEKPHSYPKYDPNRQTGEMRLNRFIAQSGICSRREADDYISAGLVSVNGKVVTELGTKVSPTDEVRFNDSRVQGEHKVYLVLNKPKGYVTSLEDPHAEKTVMELVKGACTERIYPVGRLDKNSVGLLLFTNDGDLTRQLTHPSLKKKKVYQVSLDKPLTRTDMDRIAEGITLDDGEIYADEISYVKDDKKEIGIEIHSGRNRIVRRIFEHLGYSVQKLDRVYYAGLTKKNLKRGAWRFLTDQEVARLKSGQYE